MSPFEEMYVENMRLRGELDAMRLRAYAAEEQAQQQQDYADMLFSELQKSGKMLDGISEGYKATEEERKALARRLRQIESLLSSPL